MTAPDHIAEKSEFLLHGGRRPYMALWYAENHRPEWMCLSLLSGGCGSKGFIADQAHPEILFAGKSFNSLGFALRRNEWERHFCPVWLSDLPIYNCEGREAHGWDWSVYLHLIMTQGLFALQPAAARATHTGRYGEYCRPEFHDSAFTGLDLAESSAAERSYRVLPIESLPASLRRQASLWEQTNSALRVMNKTMPQLKILLHKQEELRQLTILWAFRMFLGRDPETDEYNQHLTTRGNGELIAKIRATAEFRSIGTQLKTVSPPKLPVDFTPNSREAVIWAYLLLLQRKPENQTVVENHARRATIGDVRRVFLGSAEYKRRFPNSERDAMGRAARRLHPSFAVADPIVEQLMSKLNDLSRSLVPLNPDTTLIAVIEMRQSSWLVAGIVPGIERQPLKKLDVDKDALLKLLHRWRDEAVRAGRDITRIAVAYEAGRDGFWLARWLRAQDIEAHVIHASSVARAVARHSGLTGSPDESGAKRREKGLSRSGNARVRRGMVELAWRFLRFQKDSALAQWFRTRTEHAHNTRKTMIVAMARKLIIALWHFAKEGVVPDGVVLRSPNLRPTR